MTGLKSERLAQGRESQEPENEKTSRYLAGVKEDAPHSDEEEKGIIGHCTLPKPGKYAKVFRTVVVRSGCNSVNMPKPLYLC